MRCEGIREDKGEGRWGSVEEVRNGGKEERPMGSVEEGYRGGRGEERWRGEEGRFMPDEG